MDLKKHILDIVIKHLRQNVEQLEDQEIDPSQSMMTYGASSMDVVEVVMAAMRELEIKVPRAQLAGLKNINELVELFARIKNQEP
jgi:polyketide biosynthesis acyl carrier protein